MGRFAELLLFTFCALKPKENPKLEMNDLIPRFPHLMEQILQKVDDKGLAKSREIARSWQNFVDGKKYPWLRIVNIPTILKQLDTYLQIAAKCGQVNMFKVIIESEDDKNSVSDNGYTPFHVACRSGSVKIVEMLLEKSDEFKIDLSRKTKSGSTPFLLACGNYGNLQIAELIMKNSNKIRIDLDEMKRAVKFVCGSGQTEIAKMLIKNSISMNIELNIEFNPIIHYLCQLSNGNADIVKILMEESTRLKLDLNVQDKSGSTAFHIACRSGNANIVKLLLDQSESLNIDLSLKTLNAQTGFHLACCFGHTSIVEMLINKSESCKLDLTAKDNNGKTGFQLAVRKKKFDIVGMIKSKMPSLIV